MIQEKELLKYWIAVNTSALTNDELEKEFDYDSGRLSQAVKVRDNAITWLGHKSPTKSIFTFAELQMMTGSLFTSKNYKIEENMKNLLLNTDIEIKDIRLPFASLFLQANINITEDIYVPGILIWDLVNKDNIRTETAQFIGFDKKELDTFLITYIIVNKKTNEQMLCTFFSNETNKSDNLDMMVETNNELGKIYSSHYHRKMLVNFIHNFLRLLYNPEVETCYKEYTDIRIKRKHQAKKDVENHYYLKVKGKLREYISSIDNQQFTSEYLKRTTSWIVRGYYKTLLSDFYKEKKGQEIYVPPLICGLGSPKDKEYIVGDKVVWKNQLLLVNTVKELFPNHLVLTNSRGYLDGLEIDCYIPDLRLGFEYNGKQHYELVDVFHKNEDDLEDIKKRDKLKNRLAKERNITLITIDYMEDVSKELVIEKLREASSKKIISIEDIGERDVYDLKVEDNNNFYLANDILSENSGKTCKGLSVIQFYQSHGYKVFDIYGGKRGEGMFWAFPNDDEKLWEAMRKETYDFKSGWAKQYKCNFLYPCFKSRLPKELPHNPPNIKSKVFTIPLNSIERSDVSLVVGGMGVEAQHCYNVVRKNATSKSNGEDAMYLFDTELKKYKDSSIYRLFYMPLAEENLFSGEDCDLVMDWEAEASDKEIITVLCLDYVPEEYKWFIMGYIMRTLFDLVVKDKIHKKNIAFFREASGFMKVVDKNTAMDEITQIFRNQITDIARYGRSGIFLFMDNQDSAEVKSIVDGSEDLLLLNEMPGQYSREVTCEPLRKDRRMNPSQIRQLAVLPIEQMIVVPRGEKAKILKRVAPPRCRYWKSQYGNFNSLWKKEVDKYTKSIGFTQIIEEQYKTRKLIFDSRKATWDEQNSKRKKNKKIEDDDEKDDFEDININKGERVWVKPFAKSKLPDDNLNF